MASHLPVSLNLTGKNCTVVGGGRIALRKVQALLQAQGKVRLVSPDLRGTLTELADQGRISWIKDSFRKEYLKNSFLVIAATDNRQVNSAIAGYCNQHNVLVNVVDCPEECSFMVNAAVSRGQLLLGISTQGKLPALSAAIRKDLEESYGPEFAELLNILGDYRDIFKFKGGKKATEEVLRGIMKDTELFKLLQEGQLSQARERVSKCILLS